MGTVLTAPYKPSLMEFQRLPGFPVPGQDVHLKLEGLNPTGSVKFKPAQLMIWDLETQGKIQPGRHTIIESSSGNLGVALASVCAQKGYAFICVSDPNISPVHNEQIRHHGGEVMVVTAKDANGGYLQTRLNLIQHLLRDNPTYVWTNQYGNPANPLVHYLTTGPEIHTAFPHLGYLFIGAGTTGTLVGCARYFQEHAPATAIIAVDAVGSVTFGGPAARRYIPGLGTSRRPEISTEVASLPNIKDIIMIPEPDTIRMCHAIRERYGLQVGGSTGTVLCGVQRYQERLPAHTTVVAISPDMGERYAATVYNPEWVFKTFGIQL